jgi:hypothetical protein
MGGKRVRCRKCQDTFDVPRLDSLSEEAYPDRAGRRPAVERDDLPPIRERSRRRDPDRDREDDRDERRPRRRSEHPLPSNAWVWWVLGGLGALLLAVVLLCGGIVWIVSNEAGKAVDKAVQGFPNMPPPPLPPPVEVPNFNPLGGFKNLDEALAALRSPDVNQRRGAVEWLVHNRREADPKRRQEVIDALEPLLRDPDLHVRAFARHAQILWRNAP